MLSHSFSLNPTWQIFHFFVKTIFKSFFKNERHFSGRSRRHPPLAARLGGVAGHHPLLHHPLRGLPLPSSRQERWPSSHRKWWCAKAFERRGRRGWKSELLFEQVSKLITLWVDLQWRYIYFNPFLCHKLLCFTANILIYPLHEGRDVIYGRSYKGPSKTTVFW